MNLSQLSWLVLNAKCEIVVFTQCSRKWLFCDNQNIVHVIVIAYIYMVTSNEEIYENENLKHIFKNIDKFF